jgi:hypothetical protein
MFVAMSKASWHRFYDFCESAARNTANGRSLTEFNRHSLIFDAFCNEIYTRMIQK